MQIGSASGGPTSPRVHFQETNSIPSEYERVEEQGTVYYVNRHTQDKVCGADESMWCIHTQDKVCGADKGMRYIHMQDKICILQERVCSAAMSM